MGTYDLRCLLGDLILFLLGDEFFERCAWGCGFQGLVCLGTSISAPLLLRDLLGVDLLGSARQGCIRHFWYLWYISQASMASYISK